MEVAPFISRDKLKKAVDLVAEGELCEEHIVSLAPILGATLRRAIGRIPADSIDLTCWRSAPFLGPDFVEELIFRKVRPEQVGTAVEKEAGHPALSMGMVLLPLRVATVQYPARLRLLRGPAWP